LTEIDGLFTAAREGDVDSFEAWMGSVELPIRLSLRRFARAVDVESVVQETLMRMWVLAQDTERVLEGENASLRFALGMARNIARAEARRTGRETLLPPEDLPEIEVPPEPPSDHRLREAILGCIEKLAKKPLLALRARLRHGGVQSDSQIASWLDMTTNTFLQNIVRARRQVAACLERQGIEMEGIWV
jgi:DNA-directed RNA polymerase specialized sigma24 family protein